MKVLLQSSLVLAIAAFAAGTGHAQTSEFRQTSVPASIVNQTSNPATGMLVQTVNAPAVSGIFTFSEWTLNGARVEDFSGSAANPARFIINSNTDAVAIYLPTTDDTDTDGLPDWWERRHFGDLSPLPADNPDGDLLSNADEFARGRSPRVADTFELGGISRRRSPSQPVFANAEAFVFLRETSTPPGVIDTIRAVSAGVSVAVTTPPVISNGSRFSGWLENGSRIDVGGQAQPISVTLNNDRHLVARYIPESQDNDSDTLADWQEMLFFEGMLNTPLSDPDGDGFTIAEENLRGISLVADDNFESGGISRRRSAQFFADSTGRLPFTINSSPATIQNQLNYHPVGSRVSVPDLKNHNFANYRFSWWTLDGMRMTDSSGAGVSTFSFNLDRASTATAHYIDPSLDTDNDGILDILEWTYFGGLSRTASEDPDGDSLSIAEEILRNQSPSSPDTLELGGVSRRRGSQFTTDRTGRLSYRLTSTPAGVVEQTQYHPPGTTITVPSRQGDQQANYRFTWYSLNGTRVNDASGAAAFTFTFPLDHPSTVIAHYLDSTADTDMDNIADWIEIVYFNTLVNPSGSDEDADTFFFSEEIARSQSPAAADLLEPGGVSRRRSATMTYDPLLVAEPPRIGALRAVRVGSTSATLFARINPMSAATQASFEYGLTPSYGSTAVSESILNGFSSAPMIVTIGGLLPDTVYHFRVTATNALGTTVSTDGTFRTLPGVSQYEIWRVFYNVGGLNEDGDYDGYNNLMEFALGGVPDRVDTGLLVFELDEFHLHILHWRSHAALNDGYSFVAEWSGSLTSASWSNAGVVTSIISDNGQFQRVRHSIPRYGQTRRFGRVSISLPSQ